MNSLKKIINLILILSLFVGCNLISDKNNLDVTESKDFNFIFNYGVNAKNKLDTINGSYTKDMVLETPITIDLILSYDEMNSIYSEMEKINIMNYPDVFEPKSNVLQEPFNTYSIKIIMDDNEKNIYWKDDNNSQSKEAISLRNLFEKIETMINEKDEYKELPEAKGGYN